MVLPYLPFGPLLYGDIPAGGGSGVEGGEGAGDVEGHLEVIGQHGEAEGADLVHHIAVGGHPVGTDDDQVDAPGGHQAGGGAVADQGEVDAGASQFPSGQAGALEQWPRFIHIHMEIHPGLVVEVQGRGGGAQFGDSQSAGVAVGEHVAAGLNEAAPMLADGAAGGGVLPMDGLGLLDQGRCAGLRRTPATHPLNRPTQIDGGWPGGDEGVAAILQNRLQAGFAIAPGGHRQGVGGSDADGRRPAHG